MNIFIFLALLCSASLHGVTIDPDDELDPLMGGYSAPQSDHLMLPEELLSTKLLDDDYINTSINIPNSDAVFTPPAQPRIGASNRTRVPAYAHYEPAYSYKTMFWFGGGMFLACYGYIRLILCISEWVSRRPFLACDEKTFPRATAWINQEMAHHGLKKEDYILQSHVALPEWTIPYQTQRPYILTVPFRDLQEIEHILGMSLYNSLLDRHRCSLHIAAAQLSSRFISQSSAQVKSVATWTAASMASICASLVFLCEKEFKQTNLFDDLVHTALPCFTLYQCYKSIRKLNTTEMPYINQAIDTIPDALVPTCIRLFKEKKRLYANTTFYDEYIKRLTERSLKLGCTNK